MFVAMHVMRSAAPLDPVAAARRTIGLASWTPGLREVELLHAPGEGECVLVSRWDAEEHFERWLRAASFVAAQRSRDAGVEIEIRRYGAVAHACRACARHRRPAFGCN